MIDAFFRRGNERIDLMEHLFLDQKVPPLKYLILTCGDIGNTRIDHDFLPVIVDVAQWIFWLVIVKLLTEVVIDSDFLLLVARHFALM